MLDTLRMLIADSLPTIPDAEPPIVASDIRVAACALLLEVAYADRHFSRDERVVITNALTTHFGVDERGAAEIVEVAEAELLREPTDESFTRQVMAEYDDEQKVLLAQMLWDVAHAEGAPADEESLGKLRAKSLELRALFVGS